jgi:YD repeat-containing protein
LGGRSQVVYPDSTDDLFGYDANNNRIGFKTRAGQTITFFYDALNRLFNKSPAASEPIITYGYDYTGRLLQLQAGGDVGPYVYGYDSAGRAVSETRPDGGNHSYHFTDAQGSVVALANAAGQLTEKHAYSALRARSLGWRATASTTAYNHGLNR